MFFSSPLAALNSSLVFLLISSFKFASRVRSYMRHKCESDRVQMQGTDTFWTSTWIRWFVIKNCLTLFSLLVYHSILWAFMPLYHSGSTETCSLHWFHTNNRRKRISMYIYIMEMGSIPTLALAVAVMLAKRNFLHWLRSFGRWAPRTRMGRTQRSHTFSHIYKLKTHRPVNEGNIVPQSPVGIAVLLQQLEVLGLHETQREIENNR